MRHAAAHAQPAPGWKQMTAKQLAAACHAGGPGPARQLRRLRRRHLRPAVRAHAAARRLPAADFTPDLLAQVVTAYADTHEDGPAPAAIGQAIVRFFPCPEQQR